MGGMHVCVYLVSAEESGPYTINILIEMFLFMSDKIIEFSIIWHQFKFNILIMTNTSGDFWLNSSFNYKYPRTCDQNCPSSHFANFTEVENGPKIC